MMSAWEIMADIADAMPLVAVTVGFTAAVLVILYLAWRVGKGRDDD